MKAMVLNRLRSRLEWIELSGPQHRNVTAPSVRVGTYLLVCLGRQRRKIDLRYARILYPGK